MRFKRRTKNHIHLENVALTDIIMNLFLFFVISFGLTSSLASTHHESPLKVELPRVNTGSSPRLKPLHEIFLTKSGEILWDSETIKMGTLRENLSLSENRNGQISLKADRNASVQALVSILDTIRASGATNVALQTEIKT